MSYSQIHIHTPCWSQSNSTFITEMTQCWATHVSYHIYILFVSPHFGCKPSLTLTTVMLFQSQGPSKYIYFVFKFGMVVPFIFVCKPSNKDKKSHLCILLVHIFSPVQLHDGCY